MRSTSSAYTPPRRCWVGFLGPLLLHVRFSFVLRNVALSLGLAVALSVAAAASVNRDNNFLNWNWMKWFAYNIIYTMNANKLRRTARELAERAERQETWDLRRAFPFYLSDRLPGNSLTVAAASSPFPFPCCLSLLWFTKACSSSCCCCLNWRHIEICEKSFQPFLLLWAKRYRLHLHCMPPFWRSFRSTHCFGIFTAIVWRII